MARRSRRHQTVSPTSGRTTRSGQQAESGQLDENHATARSNLPVCMSAPVRMALSFLVSPNTRQLTVVSEAPVATEYADANAKSWSIAVILAEISVILPQVSTVILPVASPAVFRSLSAAMEDSLDRVLARIERRLAALGKTATAASREAGKPDAIRNIRRAVEEGGRQGVSTSTIAALAKPLATTSAWLLSAVGAEEVDEERTVPVWGSAGAGGAVYRFHETDTPVDRITAPIDANERTSALEVTGESLGRIFDGWYAIYDEVRDPPTEDLLGQLCVLQLSDGRVYIKRLKRGRGQRFTLESNYEAPIENVIVVWAAKVLNIRPR